MMSGSREYKPNYIVFYSSTDKTEEPDQYFVESSWHSRFSKYRATLYVVFLVVFYDAYIVFKQVVKNIMLTE